MHTTIHIDPAVQTIIWDLDGTLLDSFGIYQDCLNAALRDYGLPKASEHILRHNHHGTVQESIANVLQQMGQTITEEELTAIIEAFFVRDNVYIQDVDSHLFEDAVALAEQVHQAGKRQIIVTNRPHGIDRQNGSPRNMVQNSRLRNVIDTVLCGDDSEYRKPLRKVLEAQFGVSVESLGTILVIGDQFVDAEFARNIGCRAILVQRAEKIAHLERLANWKSYADIVSSLRQVAITPGVSSSALTA